MSRIDKHIKRVIRDRVRFTQKSERFVVATLINSGEYQRMLDGEKLPMMCAGYQP
jgi:hypothetical protein